MSTRLHPPRIGAAWCGLALLLSPAAGQDTPPTTPPAETTAAPVAPPAPEVVAVGDVPTRAEEVETTIAAIEDALSSTETIEEVEQAIGEIPGRLETLATRLDAMLDRHHRPSQLIALRGGWQEIDEELAGHSRDLAEMTSQIEGWLGDTTSVNETWVRTQEAARQEAAPPAVLQRISEILATLRPLDTRLTAARNTVVELDSRLIAERRKVQAGLKRIDEGLEALEAALLVPQQPPIWRAIRDRRDLDDQLARLNAVVRGYPPGFVEYVTVNADRMALQAFVILVFGILFTRARRTLRRALLSVDKGEVAEPSTAARAVARPWLAAVLLGLVLAPFLHPHRTSAFTLPIGLLSVPLVLTVVPPLVPGPVRRPLIGLALLAFVEFVRFVVIDFDLVNRLLVLAETLACAGALSWFQRRKPLLNIVPITDPWLRLLRGWAWLILAASALGLLTTIFGFLNLADRLLTVVVLGSYSAAVWYAAVHMVEAVLEAVARSGKLDLSRTVRDRRPLFLMWSRRLLRLVTLAAWGYILLNAVQVWAPVRVLVGSFLSLRIGIESVSFTPGGALAFFLTLYFSWQLSRFVAFALDQELFSRIRTAPGVPFTLETFARYTVLVLGFVIAVAMLGVPVERLTLVISALGVGIGFGLQNVVNNFVSGIILLSERRIRVGDTVQLDTLWGTVEDIGIRASSVRTFDGSDVIVPNGDLVGARLINWTLSDRRRRVSLQVRVAPNTDAERAIEALLGVATAHEEVLDDPAPETLFTGFGESALEFELRAWTESPRGAPAVKSDLAVSTQKALAEAGIEIPFPLPEIKDAIAEVATGRDD